MRRCCSVESEIGRIPMTVYGVLASALKPNERLWGFSYVLLLLSFCKDMSYRKSCACLNASLHRPPDGEIRHRTVADFVENFGSRITEELKMVADRLLEQFRFNPETILPKEEADLPAAITSPTMPPDRAAVLAPQIQQINNDREGDAQIKHPGLADKIEPSSGKCCYISVDDIGVKHQNDHRGGNRSKDGKYVENTVIHVQADGSSYCITAIGMERAFSILLAFLLKNGLMEDRLLVFFTDGARNIKNYIESVFAFRQFTIVLDWYHLKKKCKELISSSIKGSKEEKHEVMRHLLRMLWVGNADEAGAYLQSLDPAKIKSAHWRDELVNYIERKSPDIACYALRNALGLRVSSNRVEKANDLIVGQRQKHNGMSWSFDGSGALAAVNMILLNGEEEKWLRSGCLSFSMPQNKVA